VAGTDVILKDLKNSKVRTVLGQFWAGKKFDALDGSRWLKMVLEGCGCMGG
jgi:hypothetical protein